MNKHELYGNLNSRTEAKRLGRGIGSGKGKTCGTGGKGQGTRSGKGKIKGFFEGGQLPLTRRLPKLGFTNNFTKHYNTVNVSVLAGFKANTVVDEEFLIKEGILKKPAQYGLKVLGNGDLSVALTVKANKVTEGAMQKITKAGGKVEVA